MKTCQILGAMRMRLWKIEPLTYEQQTKCNGVLSMSRL